MNVLMNSLANKRRRKLPAPKGAISVFLSVPIAGYLLYIATGPYPVFVGGIQLEILFGLFTIISCLILGCSYGYRSSRTIKKVLPWMIFYWFVSVFSTLFSSDVETSMNALIATTGYMMTTLLFSSVYTLRVAQFRLYMFICSVSVALFALVRYQITGWSPAGIGRYTIAAQSLSSSIAKHEGISMSDPNTVAIGLGLSFIIFMPDILWIFSRKTKNREKLIVITGGTIVLSAMLLFQSRTALLATLGSALLVMLWQSFRFTTQTQRRRKRKHTKSIILLIITILLAFITFTDEFYATLDRFTYIFEEENYLYDGRIILIQNALSLFNSSIKTILIGDGYFTINPHNEIFRALGGSGIFGGIALIGMILSLLKHCCFAEKSNLGQTSQLLLFCYLVLSMQTYFMVKPFWVAAMFLIANRVDQEIRKQDTGC